MRTNPSRGYAALISVLIIAAILLALSFSASVSLSFARADTLRTEEQAQSQESADACLRVALLGFAEDQTYRPQAAGQIVTLDSGHTCTIESLTLSGSLITIKARATEGDTVSAREAKATISSGVVTDIHIHNQQ